MGELRAGLELATEEELRQLTQILFCRRFNPLDYWQTPEPSKIETHDWEIWLDNLEYRFRFLAADGWKVLQRRTQDVTYRQALLQVCHYLKVSYSQAMTTLDIEAEVFLHLVGQTWKHLAPWERKSLTQRVQKSIAKSNLGEPLPVQLQHDPVNFLLKGGSVLAVSSCLKPLLLRHIARQFAMHFARYQVAKGALLQGGAVAGQLYNQVAVQSARRGMAVAAARHTAVKSIFATLGPLLWGCFLADVGWRAIATNYGRIIPTVFALAQIRLTRTESWENSLMAI